MDGVAAAHVVGSSVGANGLEGAGNSGGGDVSAAEVVLLQSADVSTHEESELILDMSQQEILETAGWDRARTMAVVSLQKALMAA